jgi:hypothetical protein
MGFLSACSSKTTSVKSNNISDENKSMALTEIESLETGIIAGAIIGKITGAELLSSVVVGSAVGLGAGNKLLHMQLKYLEEENYLLDKISKSVENQEKLSSDMNGLKIKMSELNSEIQSIKGMDNSIKSREGLLEKIDIKKERIIKLKKLNNSVIDDVLAYKNLLSYTKYPEEKKKEIKKILDNVLLELFALRGKCKLNLEKLNDLEQRIF